MACCPPENTDPLVALQQMLLEPDHAVVDGVTVTQDPLKRAQALKLMQELAAEQQSAAEATTAGARKWGFRLGRFINGGPVQ